MGFFLSFFQALIFEGKLQLRLRHRIHLRLRHHMGFFLSFFQALFFEEMYVCRYRERREWGTGQ